ncbi:helix-turn-helix domain-containing protein [Streptomyces laculatispora]|uniref:helix-turn-helix domain-containing protein n=1 Tax=Streptomyces laculatispora TaxID=887464 RepID=UPI003555E955
MPTLPPSDAERSVQPTTLLLAGHTGAAVAARLGVSLRTVQRRVRHLMDQAGTVSWISRGWYPRDRDRLRVASGRPRSRSVRKG